MDVRRAQVHSGTLYFSPQMVEPHIIVGDIRHPKTYREVLAKMDALVILSSATPRVGRWSAFQTKLKVLPNPKSSDAPIKCVSHGNALVSNCVVPSLSPFP